MKVPLSIAWLSENDLLDKAVRLIGYDNGLGSANRIGVQAKKPGAARVAQFHWVDYILLSLTDLKQLGFE